MLTQSEDASFQRWAAMLVLRDNVRESVQSLFGKTGHWRILAPFFRNGPLTMSQLARECGVPESAVRRSGSKDEPRVGWVREILDEYEMKGILRKKVNGNRVVYELDPESDEVVMLRELRVFRLQELLGGRR